MVVLFAQPLPVAASVAYNPPERSKRSGQRLRVDGSCKFEVHFPTGPAGGQPERRGLAAAQQPIRDFPDDAGSIKRGIIAADSLVITAA